VFWQNYNILKTTPLEDSIVRDLERKQNLDGQFADFVSSERERYFSGKEDEEKFNRFLESNRGVRPVYIDFWASWCGPCIAQMPASKELVEKYKGRIAFVYLSLDDDIEAWKKMVKKLDLEKPFLTNHFRIGSQSDAATVFEIAEIPRYVLIDKQGNFVDTRAKGPGSEQLRKQLDLLLGEN
jgi:thiol-disulfide isomerase/thioredoxin